MDYDELCYDEIRDMIYMMIYVMIKIRDMIYMHDMFSCPCWAILPSFLPKNKVPKTLMVFHHGDRERGFGRWLGQLQIASVEEVW